MDTPLGQSEIVKSGDDEWDQCACVQVCVQMCMLQASCAYSSHKGEVDEALFLLCVVVVEPNERGSRSRRAYHSLAWIGHRNGTRKGRLGAVDSVTRPRRLAERTRRLEGCWARTRPPSDAISEDT
jgi:hypothetical protein